MGKNLTDEQLAEALAEIDEDGSGEVEFAEFEVWWDKEMSNNAAVMPNVFNFRGSACRALKLDRKSDTFYWVASDVANVLFPVEKPNKKMT